MALYREKDLAINEVYADIAKNSKKRLEEAVTSGNSIHSSVESAMEEFTSNLTSSVDAEATEEKLRELEKDDLTNLDKKIIGAIRKLVTNLGKTMEDFQKFQKDLKYEFVINKKNNPSGEDEVSEEEAVPAGDSESELKGADEQFEPAGEGEPKVESKFTSVNHVYAALTEKKAPKQVCGSCKEELKKCKDGLVCKNKDCKKFDKVIKAKEEK